MVMTEVESEEAERVMDLARTYHDRAREHESTARQTDDPQVQTVNQAHADSYRNAASLARRTALFLDGQTDDVPVHLVAGRAMKSMDDQDGDDDG